MTDVEISVLVLLAKGVFVLVSAFCIAEILKCAMAGKGRGSVRPLLIWLAWALVTWLGGFLLFVLANANTHIPGIILMIRLIVLAYLFIGAALSVYLVKRLRVRDTPGAG